MSDENITNESTETETNIEVTPEPQGDKEETDWKSEARKWETRAKADHELANKWREYEVSQKSEHEKLADRLAQAERDASEASVRLLRYEVAAQKGIPASALDLLTGSSKDELESSADKLLSLIADQSKPKTPMPDENQGKPAPKMQGQLSHEDLKTMTPTQIETARKAGQLDDLLGKK
jgi:hypothetical protein